MKETKRKVPLNAEKGIFHKLIREMKKEIYENGKLYNILSNFTTQIKASSQGYGYDGSITEKLRCETQYYIHEWLIDNSLEDEILILREIQNDITMKIKTIDLIRRIEGNLSDLKELWK